MPALILSEDSEMIDSGFFMNIVIELALYNSKLAKSEIIFEKFPSKSNKLTGTIYKVDLTFKVHFSTWPNHVLKK